MWRVLARTPAIVPQARPSVYQTTRAFSWFNPQEKAPVRVRQRRRSRGQIIQAKQTHYVPKPDNDTPLPRSLMATGPIRRAVYTRSAEAESFLPQIDWHKYQCDVRGVRWHANGSWRVQFDRRNFEHNFFVKCSMYFRVGIYGFDKAKALAINYRKRCEAEWEEQEKIWATIDKRNEEIRREKKARWLAEQDEEGSRKFEKTIAPSFVSVSCV